MAKTTIATAEQVREWARDNNYEVADRGRFNTDLIRAFNNDRENKRAKLHYEPTARSTSVDRPAAEPRTNSVPNPRRSDGGGKAEVRVIPASEVADSIPSNVLEMLRAASAGGSGRGQAIVSIHALVDI